MYIVKTYMLDLIRWNITALQGRRDRIQRILDKAQLGSVQTTKMIEILDSDKEKILRAEEFFEEVRTTENPSEEQMDEWCRRVENLR